MADIKPSEVSSILRKELSGFDSKTELEEVGYVLEIGDGIARAYGLNSVAAGELVEFDNGTRGIVLNLEEDNVGIVLMGQSKDLREGSTVRRTKTIASINVGEGMLGRVIDPLGNPKDNKGPIVGGKI
jgi:F-type H+-transporting ATPase subunit alpha